MAQPERPLSPFMQYRWQYTNTLSILHRITGILLSLCFFVLVYWLAAAAAGPERYSAALQTLGSPLVKLALVILGCWFFASLAMLGAGATHDAVTHWLRSPFSAVMAMLLVAVAAYHAQLGLQVVFEDYISDKGTRLVVLVALKFALVVAALVGILAVLRIAFGAQA